MIDICSHGILTLCVLPGWQMNVNVNVNLDFHAFLRPLRFPTERGACHDAPGRRPLMRDVIAPDYIRLVCRVLI